MEVQLHSDILWDVRGPDKFQHCSMNLEERERKLGLLPCVSAQGWAWPPSL